MLQGISDHTIDLCSSAFILRPKSARSSEPASQEYSVEQAFPILSGFTIAMAQTRRNTIDLTSATITTLKQSQTGRIYFRASYLPVAYRILTEFAFLWLGRVRPNTVPRP